MSKDSRFEETLLHNDISNFTEDDLTHSYEPVISDLDTVSIYEKIEDTFHIENEVTKSIINMHAIGSATACLEENHRELQDVTVIEIPSDGRIQEKKTNFASKACSKITHWLREKLSIIAKKITELADRELCGNRLGSIVSKIPFAVIFIVLILCVMFNKRIHNTDIIDRFKLDCLTVTSALDFRIFSYSLVHMNFEHLIPNLIFLSLFGSIVEIKLGTLSLLISYFSMCYLVGLGWYFRKVNLIGQCVANQNSVVGSSGAVYGMMTIAFLVCLFEAFRKDMTHRKYRFWNLFGSLASFFAISVMYLNEIVFNPNEKTATDMHIIGSIIGLLLYIILLAKHSVPKYFRRK